MKNLIKSFFGIVFKNLFPHIYKHQNVRIILMYHQVLANPPDQMCDPGMYVMADTFAMHMNELSSFFEIVPLDEILFSKQKGQNLCAVTFDDGWLDNYDNAFPILKQLKIPATIFIPTEMIGTNQKFWFESLWAAADNARETDRQQEFISFFNNIISSLNYTKQITQRYLFELTSLLKNQINAIELDSLISTLSSIFCEDSNKRSLINWEECNKMGKQGVRFGSHCLHHYITTSLNSNIKSQEICASLKQLKENTSAFTPFFSYPNGDWDDESISLIDAAGYKGAVTTMLGTIKPSTDQYLLNRIPMHDYISKTPALLWFRLFQAIQQGK